MWGRWIVLLLVLGLGWGCSIKFAYNNLDRFVRWGISDYLQMTPEQRRYFDAEFPKLHDWHRRTQLPEYAVFLDSLPPRLAAGIDLAELHAMEQTVQGWADQVMGKALPMTAQILRRMNDAQVAEFPARLDESNRDIADPARQGDLRELQKRWARDVADGFKRVGGRMTSAQLQYVMARSVDYVPHGELLVEYRARWQADLLTLLRMHRQTSEFEQRFVALAGSLEDYYGAELSGVFSHNEKLSREIALWLLGHLTDAQRRRFERRMLELAADFRELAGSPAQAMPLCRDC